MVWMLAAAVSRPWFPPRLVVVSVLLRVWILGRPLPMFGPARLKKSDPTHQSPNTTSRTARAAPRFEPRLRRRGLRLLRRGLLLLRVLVMRRSGPHAVVSAGRSWTASHRSRARSAGGRTEQ